MARRASGSRCRAIGCCRRAFGECIRCFGRRTSGPGSRDSLVGIPAGLWDIDTFAELTNIGTLFAFIIVAASVIVLRKKQPDRPRSFRVPFVPLLPILSIFCCVILMMGLPLLTWIRFVSGWRSGWWSTSCIAGIRRRSWPRMNADERESKIVDDAFPLDFRIAGNSPIARFEARKP